MADKNARNPSPDNTTVIDISGGKKEVTKKTAEKGAKDKKKKSKLPVVIFVFILLLLVAFLTAHFYLDLFGWKESMFDTMHNLDPKYSEFIDREAALTSKEASIEQREIALVDKETSLSTREQQLTQREKELAQTEKSRVPVYRPPINDSDREYMESIAKIYASMEPENAASVMVNLYSTEDMAAIIYFMSTSKAAAILECLTPALAAQITDQLINTYS